MRAHIRSLISCASLGRSVTDTGQLGHRPTANVEFMPGRQPCPVRLNPAGQVLLGRVLKDPGAEIVHRLTCQRNDHRTGTHSGSPYSTAQQVAGHAVGVC